MRDAYAAHPNRNANRNAKCNAHTDRRTNVRTHRIRSSKNYMTVTRARAYAIFGSTRATIASVADVAAHTQAQAHHYVVHFPPHPARTTDPHYADFNAYHQATRPTARCYVGERIGYADCMDAQGHPAPAPDQGEQPGLELHHAHVEFSLQNGISLAALEHDYPGISDATSVGAWVETAANFRWLCAFHHRGAGGAHTAAHSDWEAQNYVLGLITKG